MKIDLCRHLNTRSTQEGFLVETPFCYYDHDHVIVYAKRNQDGTYLLTENGEAAERLSFDGVEVDSDRITRWLHEMTVSLNVSWNQNDQSIEVLCSESDVSLAVFRIAEAAVQVQALTATRAQRSESSFKIEMLAILKEVAIESGVGVTYNQKINDFAADAVFHASRPIAIVLASTKERLLEAELMWSTVQRRNDNVDVIAVIESPEKVGKLEADRAPFYTSKVLSFKGNAWRMQEAFLSSLRTVN